MSQSMPSYQVIVGVLLAVIGVTIPWFLFAFLPSDSPKTLDRSVTVHDGPTKLDFPAVVEIRHGSGATGLLLKDGTRVTIHSGTIIVHPLPVTQVEKGAP